MSTNPQYFVRALRLIWARMGTARIYFAVAVIVLVALATVGIWHLFSPGKPNGQFGSSRTVKPADISASPKPAQKSSNALPDASPTPTIPTIVKIPSKNDRLVAITDVTQTKKQGRHSENLVVATIGLTPRPNAVKGDVGIHVFFFDMTMNNEMRPTDAQVTYEWLTPARDWNDPTPKYLAATYLHPRTARQSSEKLRYGGFIVRVYVGDKLQDERSEPENLRSAMSEGQRSAQETPKVEPTTAVASQPNADVAPAIAKKPAANFAAPSPTSPADIRGSDTGAVPHGKPVPGKPGFVSSPFDSKFIIDVRGFPPGTLVNDPNTDKTFRVP